MTPSSRTLKFMKSAGWIAGVVERWNAHARKRIDLFSFIDIIAVRGGVTLGIQATSADNLSARVAKALALPEFAVFNVGNRLVEFHGWSKRGAAGKRKRWALRRIVYQDGERILDDAADRATGNAEDRR